MGGAIVACPRASRGGRILHRARGAERGKWLCCYALGYEGGEPLGQGAGYGLKTVLPRRAGAGNWGFVPPNVSTAQ